MSNQLSQPRKLLVEEPLAFCNDSLIPLREFGVPVTSHGFIQGTTVAEQVRTFNRRPFLLERHYDRWKRGVQLIGFDLNYSFELLRERLQKIIDANATLLPEAVEQRVSFFFVPPSRSPFCWSEGTSLNSESSIVGILSFALRHEQFESQYINGVVLAETPTCDVPPECWPPDVKIRSRLHYVLAERAATRICPGAFPILCDQNGNVSDSANASILGYRADTGLLVRPESHRFASITVDYVLDLAREMNITVSESEFTVEHLCSCDEIFLVSTPWCIFPVQEVFGRRCQIRSGFPIFRALIELWSQKVGREITS
ncbi:MAG TPA: aminotransferase class IV [Pirellulaceae bacterium]|nr:aminotransferase class IV [Pirellulaceae bacterium]HMO90858.1 aminotransferase class IV [Pirellulaceae bacterium]HMP68666.1 aminotransferase class IV [Pirellulaceae bacterium]